MTRDHRFFTPGISPAAPFSALLSVRSVQSVWSVDREERLFHDTVRPARRRKSDCHQNKRSSLHADHFPLAAFIRERMSRIRFVTCPPLASRPGTMLSRMASASRNCFSVCSGCSCFRKPPYWINVSARSKARFSFNSRFGKVLMRAAVLSKSFRLSSKHFLRKIRVREPRRFHAADDARQPKGIRIRRIETPRPVQFFHRLRQFLLPQESRSVPKRHHGKTFRPARHIHRPLPGKTQLPLFRLAQQHLTG